MEFRHDTLDNGLEIIAEVNPRAYSAAIGFFVRAGARDESPEISGVSHFLEHMAFKGNEHYSADDVNRVFDELGAKYNASTGEEFTLFYAAILPEYLDRTFELLTALLTPSLRETDFGTEKHVILEEIGMYEDMPAFVAHDHAMQTHFGNHPLGQSILGSTQTVGALTADQMRTYHRDHYRAGNLTLVVAGNIHWEQLGALARTYCADWPAGKAARDVRPPAAAGGREFIHRPASQQEHITQVAAAPSAVNPLRFAAELLSVIVGDEVGSRLYWELVDPGHVEAAELSFSEFEGAGAWMTYLCCRPEEAAANLNRVRDLYANVNGSGVTEEELARAKSKAAARIVLHSERPMGRLSSLGGNWLYRREYRSVQDDLNSLQAISPEDIRRVLQEYPLGQTTTVGVGPLTGLS